MKVVELLTSCNAVAICSRNVENTVSRITVPIIQP